MKLLSSVTTMYQLMLRLYLFLAFAWKMYGCRSLIAKLHRITESQNVRIWKGPLWVT